MRRVSSSLAFTVAATGIATYSAMDVLMKGLSITSGAYAAVLWRSVVGVILLGTIFVLRRRPFPGRAALRLHILRGATAGFSVLLFFWGLVRVPMAQGVALTFLAPLIALYFAAALLGETIRRAAILGSIVASLGVLIIAAGEVQGHASTAHVLGSLAIFAASIFYAYSLILLRQQAQVADPLEVALFTSVVLGVCCCSVLRGSPAFRRPRSSPRSARRRCSGRSRRWRSHGRTAMPRRRCSHPSNIPRSSGRRCSAGGFSTRPSRSTPRAVRR